MLFDGIKLVEGSAVQNLTIDHGIAFPVIANLGELFYRTDSGTTFIYNGTTWTATSASVPVQSVFGRVGAVVLTSSDVTGALAFTPASLDGTGHIPVSQIPASLVGGLNYQGTYNPATNTPALVSGVGTKGFYYKVSAAATGTPYSHTFTAVGGTSNGNYITVSTDPVVAGVTIGMTVNGRVITSLNGGRFVLRFADFAPFNPDDLVVVTGNSTLDGISQFNVGDLVAFNGTTWDKIDGIASEVLSVAGRSGAVILSTSDVSGAAALASPVFTGVPTAPTAISTDSSTALATTAFVKAQGYQTTASAVTSVAGRIGAVVLTSSDVTTALTFTPYNATNPAGYITVGANSSLTSLRGLGYGTAAAPSIAFSGDTTTGIFGSAGSISLAAGGSPRLQISGNASSGVTQIYGNLQVSNFITSPTFSGQVTVQQALATAPGFTISGDLSTGIWAASTGLFSIAQGGVNRLTISATGTEFFTAVRVPTMATADSSTNVASTAFIKAQGYALQSSVGAISGIASLDSSGKLPTSQIPAALVGAMQYQGTFDPSTNTPALASGAGTKGQFYKVSVASAGIMTQIVSTTVNDGGGSNVTSMRLQSTPGTVAVGQTITVNGQSAIITALNSPSINYETFSPAMSFSNGAAVTVSASATLDGITQFNVGDFVAFNGTTWDKIDGIASEVLSVAGRTGVVVIGVADVSGAASLASPALTGTPTAPTAAALTSTTQLATTAFVTSAIAAYTPAPTTSADGGSY